MIVLSGQPKSTNHIYKTTCVGKYARIYMSAEGKALKQAYQWEAKSQWKKAIRTGPVAVNMILYFKDKRKHDIDNYNKLILDSLNGIVYEDDNQIEELCVIKKYDKKNPRVEVYVV